MEPPAITRHRRPFLVPVWLTMLSMLAVVVAIGIAIIVVRTATTTTVVLVGPVEKDVGTIDDPPLSTDGEQRAQRLARMFGESPTGLSAVYVGQTRVAQQTAAPLAERLHLHPIAVPVNDAKATVSRMLHEHDGATVLLIGTSASLPPLLRALSGHDIAATKDDEYDSMFVVSIPTFGDSSVLRLRY
jgi:phosphohistidine phosphatase SixA